MAAELPVRFSRRPEVAFFHNEYRDSRPLNSRQVRALKNIMEQTFESSADRALHFYRDHPRVVGMAFVPTKDDVALLVAPLTAVEIPVGFGMGLASAAGAAAFNPIGASVMGGVAAAYTIGWYGYVTSEKIDKIRKGEFYLRWKETRNLLLENKELENLILSDPELKMFVCQITGKLPKIAIRIKDTDFVCDAEEYIEYVQKEIRVLAPGTNQKCTMRDVTFDFAHMRSMLDRLHSLMIKCMQKADPDSYRDVCAVSEFFYSCVHEEELDQGCMQVRNLCLEYLDDYPAVPDKGKRVIGNMEKMISGIMSEVHKQNKQLNQMYTIAHAESAKSPTPFLKRCVDLSKNIGERKVVAEIFSVEKSVMPRSVKIAILKMFKQTTHKLVTIDINSPDGRIGYKEYPKKDFSYIPDDPVWD